MFNDTLRVELQPLGIKVIHVITGGIKTKFYGNSPGQTVPKGSVYGPIADEIERGVAGHDAVGLLGTSTDVYARTVVGNALSRSPSTTLVRSASAPPPPSTKRKRPLTCYVATVDRCQLVYQLGRQALRFRLCHRLLHDVPVQDAWSAEQVRGGSGPEQEELDLLFVESLGKVGSGVAYF
jgi:hypothetical protein